MSNPPAQPASPAAPSSCPRAPFFPPYLSVAGMAMDCPLRMETCRMSCQLSEGAFGLPREDSRKRDKTCSFHVCWQKVEKPLLRGKKGGPESPGRLMWKEIGNRCWDPGKWSWDEAGRTKKREAHGPDPTHSSGTCSGPGWLSLSSKHSILQTWNPRREHAASELFHLPAIHTHTHPAQPSPSLPRFAPPVETVDADPVGPVRGPVVFFFSSHFLGRRWPPFPRHRKSRPPSPPPRGEFCSLSRSPLPAHQATPSASLASTPRLV